MIDIHSHILPGIDDGADRIETSLEMLRIAQRNGIKKIAATPHYKGNFKTEINEVKSLVENLNAKAKENNIAIEVLSGQEVFLDKNILNSYKEGKIGTINNSKYMLIELPFDHLPDYALDMIYELRLLNINPIIAHPERYKFAIKKPSFLNRFIEEGCTFQLNAGSIEGFFGKDVQKTSEIILRHNMCHFIASDAHSPNKRCPELEKSFDIAHRINDEIKMILSNTIDSIGENCDISLVTEKIRDRRTIFDFFRLTK